MACGTLAHLSGPHSLQPCVCRLLHRLYNKQWWGAGLWCSQWSHGDKGLGLFEPDLHLSLQVRTPFLPLQGAWDNEGNPCLVTGRQMPGEFPCPGEGCNLEDLGIGRLGPEHFRTLVSAPPLRWLGSRYSQPAARPYRLGACSHVSSAQSMATLCLCGKAGGARPRLCCCPCCCCCCWSGFN